MRFLTRLALLAPFLGLLAIPAACSDPGNATIPTAVDGGTDGAPTDQDGSKGPSGDWELKPNPEMKVTECSRAALAPPASGTCSVTKTGTAGKIFQGTVLAPTEVLHRGEVLVDANGVITCAGCDCASSPGYADASVVTCADGVISPGLINPHDHISYANNPPIGHGTERYEHRNEWRKGTNGHTMIKTKSGASQAVVRFAELRFVMGGATSTAGAGGESGLLRNLDDADTALLEGLALQPANSDTFPLGDSDGTMKESGCDYPVGRTKTATVTQLEGYLPHIAEGISNAAQNELVCTSTEDPTNGKYDLLQRQTAIIHAVGATAKDAAGFQKDQTSVIWSPRSNVDIYGNTASVTMLDASGVPIALGTDWVPSGSMNLLRELKCADGLNKTQFGKHFSDSDLWKMVTVHAAFAVGAGSSLGQLAPGYVADIAIFNGKTDKDHRAIVAAGVEDVVLVVRGGKLLYGDTALVDGLGGTACEAINAGAGDVCGTAKKACVLQDVGNAVTLAGIRAAGEVVYPLFFCKTDTVKDEPSCVPFRDEYPNGATKEDTDGDGVKNEADNCPTAFNPARPMDGGKQADTDGDTVGDACDRCPLDPGNTCTRPVVDDVDGDGIEDGADNCPEIANKDQADADKDGHGDLCDKCKTANPGSSACEVTLKALRDPTDPAHPKSGVAVLVKDVYVTGLRPTPNIGTSKGYFVQSGTTDFSGLTVFTGSAAQGVVIGNKISLSGYYAESFGISTISAPKVLTNDAATVLPFAAIPVTAADITTGGPKAEAYESMLVTLAGPLTITNDIPDGATSKFYEFVVTGSLRVDDQNFTRFGTPAAGIPYPPVGFTNGQVFTSLTGVVGSSFANSKLWPRNAADMPR